MMRPWSYSSLTKFENCPRQYYLVKEAGLVKDLPTEATEWGTRVHEAMEHRVRDKTPLPEWAAQWETLASKFDRFPTVFCERQIALDRNMQATAFDSPTCWYRGIIDIGVPGTVAYLGDYKTGKVKQDKDQLRLFAAAFMTLEPQVQRCRCQYLWLKHNKVTEVVVERCGVASVWNEFMSRIRRLEDARDKNRWLPNPSGLCGWCPVGREHCEFWKPRCR